MNLRKTLATLALSAIVLNTINFTVVEDMLGSVEFAPKAEAAHSQDLGCNQPVLNGDPQNSQYINCWVKVVRPAGDTGATHMTLGVHFENAFPGIANHNGGPEFNCTQDQPIPQNKRFRCDSASANSLPVGGTKQIDFTLHVVGQCGTNHEINSTVANVYGVNSTLITAPINFPACPAPAAPPANFATGTKSGPATVVAGQDITYTISFTNGGGTAQSVRIADVIPPGLTFKSAGSTGGCSVTGGVVYCPFQNVGPGGSISATLVFTVGANVPAGTVIDNAGDLQASNNQSFQWTNHRQTTVQSAAPQFAQGTKSGPATVVAGQDITYTISFTNSGPTAQPNIRIADVIPPGLTFKSAGSTGGCSVTGGVVYCPAQTVNPGATISATLVFTVGANVPAGTIIDNAADLQQNNNSFQWTNHRQTTVQSAAPQFPVGTKSGPATVVAGQDITYNISFTNAGPTAQPNIHIGDVIPPGLTFKSAGSTAGCAVQGGAVICPAQTVNPGASITATLVFTVGANVPAGTIIDNAADLGNPNSFQWSNHVQTTVQSAAPQFPQGTKSGPATVVAGQDITYNISFTNNGPTAQNNIRIADVIPPGLTFKSAGSTAGCAVTAGVVFCPAQTVNPGASITATLVFTVGANVPAGTIIDNAADLQQNNNSFQWTNHRQTTVQSAAPQFPQGTKSGPATVLAGQDVTYTISFTNSGPTAQPNIRIADVIPPGLTFKSAGSTAGCAVTAGVVFCPAQTVNPGATISATLVFTVAANAACNAIIDNAADLQQNNNSFQWTNHAQTRVDCPAPQFPQGSKTVDKTVAIRGDILTYTITFTNAGTTQSNIRIADVVPAGVTFVPAGSTAGCALNAGIVFCPAQTVNAGASITATLKFQVNANTACNAIIDNAADLQQNNQSFQWTNHAQTTVNCPPQNVDLSIVKTKLSPQTATVIPGQQIVYNLAVTNNGPGTTYSTVITDAVPAGTTFVSASDAACSLQGNNVVCTYNNVTAQVGATGNIQLTFLVNANAACNSTITNTAAISVNGGPVDPNSGNNQSTVQTGVNCPVQNVDLSLVKSRFDLTPIVPGSIVTYDLEITNNGPGTTYSAVVTDAIPVGTTFVPNGSTAGCAQQGNNVVCPLTNVNHPVGTRNTITLRFQVPANSACGPNTNIVNTATVTLNGVTDPNTANNSSSVTSAISCPPPQFPAGTKTVDKAVAVIGDVITYTLTFTNQGTTQQNIRLADVIPAGLTFVPAGSTAGCADSNGVVYCPAQTVNAGASITATLKFTVNANAVCNAVIDNIGDLQQNNTSFQWTNHTQTTVQCVANNADLAVTKTVSAPQVNIGTDVTFTVSVTNNGPAAATNVVLTDVLPAGLTYVTHATAQGTYNPNTGAWTIGTLNANATATLSIAATVVTLGNHVNTATVAAATADPNLNNNSASASVVGLNPAPQFTATKVADKQTAAPSDFIVYTLNAVNNGPTAQANIRLADVIPAWLTYVSQGSTAGCVVTNGVVYCPAQTVNPGASITATLKFQVNPTAQCNAVIDNIGDVQQSNVSFAFTNHTQTTVTCTQGSDLSITKTGPNTAVVQGQQISYVISVNNAGPAAATNVFVNDPLPTGLSYVGYTSPNGVTCALALPGGGGNGFVSCDFGGIAAAQTEQVTLTFNVDLPQNCTPRTLTNTATVTGGTTDPNTGNNTSTANTQLTCPVQSSADVSIVKTGPSLVMRGNNIEYKLVVSNAGPTAAANVAISDPVPMGMSFAAFSGNATCQLATVNNAQVVQCQIATLGANQSEEIRLTFSTPAAGNNCSAMTATNTATVSSNTPDPNLGNNSSSAFTTLNCPGNRNYSQTKTGPATVRPGERITYTITLTNQGTLTENIRIGDHIPTNLTFVAPGNGSQTTAGCQPDGQGNIFCAYESFAPGQSRTYQLQFQVPQNMQCGSIIDNIADAQEGGASFVWSNHAFTTVVCDTDLAVSKSASTLTPVVGSNVTFTITALNNGPGVAPNVRVNDLLPAGLTYSSATPSVGTYNQNTGVWTIGTLNNGASATLQVVAVASVAGARTNTATITGDVTDTNAGNNSASVTVTATAQTADLVVTKTASVNTVTVGSNVTFTIQVANNGPSASQNVRINDLLPAGLTFQSATPSVGTYNQTTGLWTIGTLNNGATATMTVVATATTVGTVTNTATAVSDTTDPNTANSTASVNVTINAAAQTADLVVTKTSSANAVTVGSNVTFTIQVVNNGPSVSQNVRITDVLPAGLTFQSATPSVGTYNQATGLWTIGTLNNGANATLTVVATAATAGTVINTATATSDTTDPNTTNSTASVSVTITAVVQGADLSVVKTASNTAPTVGTNVTFTIQVTNLGPNAAVNARVTDLLPAGLTFQSATPSVGTYNQTTGLWTIGTLNNGANATLTVVATAATAGTVTNIATVTSDTADSVTTNNTSSVNVVIGGTTTNADLSVTKTGTTTANRGENLTYVMTATNNGPGTATNVVVKDTFTSGIATFSNASGAQCSLTNSTELRCTIASMTSGQQVPITVVFTTAQQSTCTTGTVTDSAIISSDTADNNSANNTSATVTTNITCPQPNLNVTKTDGRSSANVGDTLNYTITITNSTNVAATNITVTDSLPSGLTSVSAGNGGNVNGNQVTWSNQTVPANGTLTLTVNGTTQNVSNGTSLTNYVTVTGTNLTGNLSASDQTTVYSNTVYNPPPIYNPPPVYQPPYNPPVYQPPINQPPVYQPPVYTPPAYKPIFPQTGTNDLYAKAEDTQQFLSKPVEPAKQEDAATDFNLIFFATLAGVFAVGSAAAAKFAGGGAIF